MTETVTELTNYKIITQTKTRIKTKNALHLTKYQEEEVH